MANQFQIKIVSAESEIFSGSATMLVVNGLMGELGIAANHTPLLTLIRPGPVRVLQSEDTAQVIFVSGGILEVQPKIVTILADVVLRADDLDEETAQKAREKAMEALHMTHDSDFDYSMARAELARAAGMLRTIQEARKHFKI